MRALLLPIWLGCAPEPPPAAEAPELLARVEQAKVPEGAPVKLELRASAPAGWTVEPGTPSAEGLSLSPAGEEGPTPAGAATLEIWRYTLSGPPGSYVIQPGGGQATGPAGEQKPLETPPIFVDIGVDGPSGGPMAELEEPPPPEAPAWALYAGVAAALLGLLVAAWLWSRRRRAPPPAPIPDPPHVVAQRAWEQARLAGMEDHPLALALSSILRAYLEAITGFPATARTTREILGSLEGQTWFGPSLRQRAAHVLDATDRLKFAREGGGEDFFRALDEDFLAVLEATRPREPAASPPPGGPGA